MSGRRILIVGQTGAGKSSITNVLYNDSVEIDAMKSPAETSYAAGGVTLTTKTYIQNAKELIVDTVGFSDNVDQSQTKFKQDLRDVFHQTRMSFTHVLFVIPFDRISKATKSALALLRTLFGDSWANVIFVVTKCDTSRQTIQEFFRVNKDIEDAKPVFDLVKDVFTRSNGARVLTGSFMYEDESSLDQTRGLKAARALFKEQLIYCLHNNSSIIRTAPKSFKEFLTRFVEALLAVTGFATKTTNFFFDLVAKMAEKSDKYNMRMKVHLPVCGICLDEPYTEDNKAAYHTGCGRIYHHICYLAALERREVCPNCSRDCTADDLVLFFAGMVGNDE